ncbi:hypothetical protein BOTNAR_0022g00020 [Botryotinia narcissicola]|uniref:Uncharacterized protein n=1 Tax=Botryotinia narcissicola TaxID=278944 RepID=A0A4Z1J5U4_9HELO|nr:hypothetical protein BOTNAR_0022g00020 [Botryotinia narcissicola]
MGNRHMTPEAAARIAKSHPGSGFARRSARAGHSNSEGDAKSQSARDGEMQGRNGGSEASSGNQSTKTDQISVQDEQEQGTGGERCPYCTSEALCTRHASKWGWC